MWTFGIGDGELGNDLVTVWELIGPVKIFMIRSETEVTRLEPAKRFLERLLERSSDGHRFTDAFHLRGQRVIGFWEFFESEPWDFRNDVVNRWFEAGFCFFGDVVGQFPKRISDGELGGDFCDRESSGLRCESTRSTNARVHLDHDHATGFRIDGKLNVRATRFDSDFTHDVDRSITHPLVFFIGKRLCRCDGDRVTGVNAHRVKVFDCANDDNVVIEIAHHFHLVFFPADDGFFDQDFTGRRQIDTTADEDFKFVTVVGDRVAAASHREAWSNQSRQSDFF